MRLSWVRSFSTTVIQCAKRSEKRTIKGKADVVLVRCDSMITGHRYNMRKARLGDKLEFIAFDPVIQQEVLYKETKKIRSIQERINTWYNKPSILKTPDEFQLAEEPDNQTRKNNR